MPLSFRSGARSGPSDWEHCKAVPCEPSLGTAPNALKHQSIIRKIRHILLSNVCGQKISKDEGLQHLLPNTHLY